MCEIGYVEHKTDKKMKNKCFNYLLAGTLAVALAACGGKAKKQAGDAARNAEPVVWENSTMKTIQLDNVAVTWIKDNAKERMMERSLFPDASDGLMDSLALQDGVPSTVSAFVVKAGDKVILFDTGLGATDSRLLSGLKALGLEPADVKYIYLTHMHGDHIGGMMTADGGVVFPNAEVYVSQPEYDYWMTASSSKQAAMTMEAYKDRLRFFSFGDTLPGGVTALEAVGHTPGHTVFRASRLLVVGDLFHGFALQYAHPEKCAAYDMDKAKAVDARRRFIRYARENGLTMAGMHLPAPAFY